MVLEIYIDPISQAARALMLFVRANKIAAEEKIVSIQKGEHKSEEYKKVNKFQQIPTIVHDGFQLAEGVAILKYLARAFDVEDHWYPKTDLKAVSRIDEFLAWQHIGLEVPLSRHFYAVMMTVRPDLASTAPADETIRSPSRYGINNIPPTPEDLVIYSKGMVDALDQMENIWLDRSKFIYGDEISIADLLAVGQIEMTRLVSYDASEGRPKLAAYLARVKDTVGPGLYDQVHENLLQTSEVFKGVLAKK